MLLCAWGRGKFLLASPGEVVRKTISFVNPVGGAAAAHGLAEASLQTHHFSSACHVGSSASSCCELIANLKVDYIAIKPTSAPNESTSTRLFLTDSKSRLPPASPHFCHYPQLNLDLSPSTTFTFHRQSLLPPRATA
ncbi:unnamed protein product [Cercospora beticola]|nr:unnamed protein product [Cercospora beticola]